MGNWHISIEGVGCHHNESYPQDANLMAAAFVQQLREAGHTVSKASFTHGGAENIGTQPVAQCARCPHPIHLHQVVDGQLVCGCGMTCGSTNEAA